MTTETQTDGETQLIVTVNVFDSDEHEHCEWVADDSERQCLQLAEKVVITDNQDGQDPWRRYICSWHLGDAIGSAS